MTRKEFKNYQCEKAMNRKKYAFNDVQSECDPSFAMTGAQMFMAAMRGEALPMNAVSYYYTNVSPDKMALSDVAYADKFEVAQALQSTENKIKQEYVKIKNKEENI